MITVSSLQCNKGWSKLYQPIIDKIIEFDSQQENVKDKIGIAYIKEKDGVMKITLVQPHNADSSIMDLIYEAENKSKSVCEYCGSETNVGITMNNTYKTCCKTCWEKNIIPMQENSIWQDLTTRKLFKKNSNV
ncbi:MAG: hypothetical protein IKT40_11935 [Bacilli bacterium]|nr:hypothetical protein [Bacilli bacterium]